MTESLDSNPDIRTGPVPGEDDVAHAQRLRADGVKVVDVARALHISERGAYRLLANGRERVIHSDIEAWSITTSIEDGDPPEKVRYLFEMPESIRWRRHDAKFAWTVHQLKPGLPPIVVLAFAMMYGTLSRRSRQDRDALNRILDLALRVEPWAGGEEAERFFSGVAVTAEDELEYSAQVFSFLKQIVSLNTGGEQSQRPDTGDVVWLRHRVAELEREIAAAERELDAEQGRVRLIGVPGSADRRGKQR